MHYNHFIKTMFHHESAETSKIGVNADFNHLQIQIPWLLYRNIPQHPERLKILAMSFPLVMMRMVRDGRRDHCSPWSPFFFLSIY